ncbi:MAG: VPLPA-CTERM sorting domain-containing protein [Deltaproteobacteria bacterium]|nr:VPLPA-CTERM sorting domain-containing protein [Deltaproteobacteria bacterium]
MKNLKKLYFLAFLFLFAGKSEAAVVTIDFDGTGILANSVYGFQVDYALSGGGSLATGDLDIYYNKKFVFAPVPGVVDVPGAAVPGTDFTLVGGGISTEWDISDTGNTILGYTLGASPLTTGTILTFDVADTFNPTSWILSDFDGNFDTFVFNDNFFANFDVASNTYTISQTEVVVPSVPVPAAVWLLGAGLSGLVALRRKNS